MAKYNLVLARMASNRVGDVISTPGGRGVSVGTGLLPAVGEADGIVTVAVATNALVATTVVDGVVISTLVNGVTDTITWVEVVTAGVSGIAVCWQAEAITIISTAIPAS